MRLSEYSKMHSIATDLVDSFSGIDLEVRLPEGWDLIESIPGMRLWRETGELDDGRFCPNAVLTMHLISTWIDGHELFAMLAEEQLLSVPESHEELRQVDLSEEGVGMAGLLVMQVPTKAFGILRSMSISRIVPGEGGVMVGQLTVTAPVFPPLNPADFSLLMRSAGSNSAESGQAPAFGDIARGAKVGGPSEGGHGASEPQINHVLRGHAHG